MTEQEIQLIVMRCLKECTQRITRLEDKGVEQVIVDTIGPMLERLTELEERNIGYKQDIVLLTQENSQMFERITELEEVVNIHDTHSHAITDIVYERLTALEESMYNVQRTLVETCRPAEPDDSEF